MLEPRDEPWVERVIALSRHALEHGNQPFGGLLVSAEGEVLLEGENTETTTGDVTGHAEINVVRQFDGSIDEAVLAGATLYASTEPCLMCCGSILMAGIRRVVYCLSADTIATRSGRSPRANRIDIHEALRRNGSDIEVIGPVAEDAAWEVVRLAHQR